MLKDFREVLAVGLSLALVTTSSYGYRNPDSVAEAGAGGATDGAPMSANELDGLVAPIARSTRTHSLLRSWPLLHFQIRSRLPITGSTNMRT